MVIRIEYELNSWKVMDNQELLKTFDKRWDALKYKKRIKKLKIEKWREICKEKYS